MLPDRNGTFATLHDCGRVADSTAMGDSALDEHIGSVDAFTLTLERDPLLRATFVAVATFDRGPIWDVLVDRVDRATRLVPRFRQKLIPSPFGMAPPRWIVDADFDLSLHLRRIRVHDGGTLTDVVEIARAIGLAAFDHDRPLWEFVLVEGLPDGKAALVMKLHHALTDGVGGIEIAAHVVDLSRQPAPPGPMPAAPEPSDHGVMDMLTDTASYHLRRLGTAGSEISRSIPRILRDGAAHPVRTIGDATTTATAITRFVRPVTRTRSPIMTERRPLRDFRYFDVPLDDLSRAAHLLGGSLNDGFLAGVAGGMRLYHQHHLAAVDHLLVTMPINVRSENDEMGGNRITVERFDLPIGITSPAHRMEQIAETARCIRQDPAVPYSGMIAGVMNLLPVDVTAGMFKHVDMLVSNVPGFPDPVYVGGALLESFHVFGATIGSALNVTLLSYDGTCHMGLSSDTGAVRDPDVLLACMEAGFDELLEVGIDSTTNSTGVTPGGAADGSPKA